MSAHTSHPTPYADVNALLHVVLSNVQSLLGEHFIGMYLYGSLASGDFDPRRSDVDFIVVLADELPDELLPALEALHARIAASEMAWATKLEGSYIPRHALRCYNPADIPRPSINEGRFQIARHGSDWVIQRHIMREQGVVVAGPPPHTLIDPVGPNDLRRAVLGILREWWSPMLSHPAQLHSRIYQDYAILTMCRALYTLHYGIVVSKPVAARWARAALGERWAAIIECAATASHDTPPDYLGETLDFIRYTLERAQQFDLPAGETTDRDVKI